MLNNILYFQKAEQRLSSLIKRLDDIIPPDIRNTAAALMFSQRNYPV